MQLQLSAAEREAMMERADVAFDLIRRDPDIDRYEMLLAVIAPASERLQVEAAA